LTASTIYPATVAVPHPLQAQRIIHEVEHALATDDYNEAYRLSYSSLHMSRATFLAHTPHTPPPKGTVSSIKETGPWFVTTIGKPVIVEVTQPIQIYTHVPGRKAQTWGSQVTLVEISDHWYWAA